MSSPLYRAMVYTMVMLTALTGCQPGRPFYVGDRGDLQYYVDQQVDIRYADTEVGLLEESTQALPPLTLQDREITAFWDLTLEDAVNIALKNTKTIRATGRPTQVGFAIQGTNASVIDNPEAPTIYEVGIRETEPGNLPAAGQIPSAQLLATNSTLDTNQGVEAALAEFDAHVASSLFWNTTDRPRNFRLIGFEQIDNEASDVAYETAITKKAATGTQFTFRTAADFNSNNNFLTTQGGGQFFESQYTARLELEVNQPLLRGRGTSVNRTPIIVARLGGDQTAANTEFFLQNMLSQIEIAYWDLYNAYRQFEVAKESVENAIKVYNIEKDNFEIGGSKRSTKATVSRSAEQYYNFVSNLNTAYAELQRRETDMRFLLGLSSNDGNFIRPIDEPTIGQVDFDWYQSINEALVLRPNLRIKQFEIKKKELAVNYAKNGLLGQLNFVFLYRFLGVGDELFGGDGIDFPTVDGVNPAAGSGAIDNLFGGEYQELQIGLQGGYTVGNRREMLNVRNAQLKLARERARLEDMELDVVHELDQAFKGLALHFEQAKTNAHRWLASHEEVKTYADLRDQGIDITNVLEAQRNEAQARIAFHNSIAEYNKFIALIHRLKGTALQYYNVQFGEGPWPDKAYYDARELARKRSASQPINYGYTRPGTVVVGNDPTDTGGALGGPMMGEVMVDQGMPAGEVIINEGDLAPLQEIEQIDPRDIETIPAPRGNGLPGNDAPPSIQDAPLPQNQPVEQPPAGRTTATRSAASILQASYIEADKSDLQPQQIRWHQLGLGDGQQSNQPRTRAKLRSID